MTEPLRADGPRKLFAELFRLVAERTPADLEIAAGFAASEEEIKKRHQAAWEETVSGHEKEKGAAEAEYTSTRQRVIAEFESNHHAARIEHEEACEGAVTRFDTARCKEKERLEEARWEATTVYEATKDGPGQQLDAIKAGLSTGRKELHAIQQGAQHLLERRRQWRAFDEPQAAEPPAEPDSMQRFTDLISRARRQQHSLSIQAIGRLLEGSQPVWLLVLLWIATAFPSAFALGWTNWSWIAVSGVLAVVVWAPMFIWLRRIARKQSTEGYLALCRTLSEAELTGQNVAAAATAECEQQRAAIRKRLEEALAHAADVFSSAKAEFTERKEEQLRRAEEKYPALLSQIKARRDGAIKEAKEAYSAGRKEIDQRYQLRTDGLLNDYRQELADAERQFNDQWSVMADRWSEGMGQFQSAIDEMNRRCADGFPDWDAPDWSSRTPATEIPPALPFGRVDVDLGRIEGGLPADDRLRPLRTEFSLPALFALGNRSLMLLRAADDGRAAAVRAIQAVMLRMLTSLPPGKVRFTIIDPVGLGENFSAFMHLADYDEQLVTSRIWTETGHIEQRLTDLTEHMENVIQVYLRNEFASIQEYNAFAGEMAEPYRILVVANFPAGFSEGAARRMASITASGARCGVYVLMSVDGKLQLPRDFRLADLASRAVQLRWREGRFVWEDADFRELPLELAGPPEAEQFTEIVRSTGQSLKDAGRIEVPFECVVPDGDAWWTGDSRSQIDVPLGRAGALKLQHLRLGKGTSQHVLIAGRTGSGKSTLLHALITSVAVHYSPDEVELYLVDFKKGVEFKAYATNELPHARVIAIESEREFGLSTLERLDSELKRRGDAFRKLGVQDLQGFRREEPEAKLPRVLLVIDEFQELFVEDDRIAQNSALLLDRLVRQGRAFGIHVLLGSQTLAGAYSLPRSTIGQMAVRIALQCSDADAHLILSEENTAARLLTRPGEAIYNDANGLYEGNHPFQVVWLPDFEREEYLRRIRQFARKRGCKAPPPIVFEGNAPADPAKNPLLSELLDAASWPEHRRGVQAWLGSAVAIKPATAAEFLRQNGSNLLMVGQREEAALGVLATCLISLAAQVPPSSPDSEQAGPEQAGARFFVFDGTRPDAPEVGFFKRLAAAVPHSVKVSGPRKAGDLLAELADEVSARERAEDDQRPPIFLIVYGLSRFRDLRKADDDFGFSSPASDRPPSPAQQFGNILREGPAVGVHTLVWCESASSTARWLDRQSLGEFQLRVLFQMNASDSSNLIDSAAASRLGAHRAVLYNEDQGRLEKFRPYATPSTEWLARVKKQLHDRLASPGEERSTGRDAG